MIEIKDFLNIFVSFLGEKPPIKKWIKSYTKNSLISKIVENLSNPTMLLLRFSSVENSTFISN